ncbi:FadR/GntR family transcriptional regulator [Citricoccus zhacaiensis]|uniref:FadR/GntR family transcriptional regulator n=1 Tax=Citricoccus zhacaiensis TaxID=489142 RepID=UPI0016686401|nr:FadR/GntR family transcriptional regulator [Citricoccus zhacaiensis]
MSITTPAGQTDQPKGRQYVDRPAQPFASVRPRRAVDAIIEQIRDRIQSNELKPGQKLPSERDLAEQLSVSRNTVREAIRMLEVSGLVTLKKGATGGAFLTNSNSAALSQNLIDGIALRQYNVKELIDVRMVLEQYIAAQACENASDEQIEELAALAQASRQAEDDVPEYEQRLDLHIEFHRKLSEMSHNGVAETLTGPLLEITRHFHLETGPTGGPETHETRQELVQALRERNPEAAKLALAKHFAALQSRLLVSHPD